MGRSLFCCITLLNWPTNSLPCPLPSPAHPHGRPEVYISSSCACCIPFDSFTALCSVCCLCSHAVCCDS